MSINLCFYANDPPDGPLVATQTEGMGKIHFLTSDGSDTLCPVGLEGLSKAVIKGMWDESHSDLCKTCLQRYE